MTVASPFGRLFRGSAANYRPGREITHWLLRKGVSLDATRKIVRSFKFLRHPVSAIDRRLKARKIVREASNVINLEDGFAPVNFLQLRGAGELLDELCSMWIKRCKSGDFDPRYPWSRQPEKTPFLRNCLLESDLADNQKLIDFVTDPMFVDTATTYLKSVPILSCVEIWWSPAVDESDQGENAIVGSQQFHCDLEDDKQLKFFVYLTDVDADTGPLTFFSKTDSDQIRQKVGHISGRITDEEIQEAGFADKKRLAVAPRGHGFVVDTSNCVHMGSRVTDKERLVMMIQYVPYNVHREPAGKMPGACRGEDGRQLSDKIEDPLRKLVCQPTY